jgi:putative ATP-dependent endonuclease of OLD family
LKLEKVNIKHYRSIENVTLTLPHNRPLVLFGPNNAGKSNILSAINRIIGERYPTYIEMLDSDYFQRNQNKYPTAQITAKFNKPLYFDKWGNDYKVISVSYGHNGEINNNLFHDRLNKKIYPTNEQRSACQSYLIDAERNIQNAFNYSSSYSLLSKFSKKIHEALSSEHKDELSEAFEQITSSFEQTDEFSSFFSQFSNSLKGAVKGFVHSLAVDFSAYDPNNYAKSLRIYAKEGNSIRGFEEFGTGEQQVLLMAFVKAYMEVFTGENFVLIIEEPEAHLHPLAQRWLKEYVVEMCSSGIQVILSTHSSEFIDAEYLDGLVRIHKEGGITKAIQLSAEQLCNFCIDSGVPENLISPDNIVDFYSTKLFLDQLKGMFAETIILVEGATEYFTLPVYLKRIGYSLAEHGTEIINCRGKDAIPLYWRLFKAYGYNCYAIFDCDRNDTQTKMTFKDIFDEENWSTDIGDCIVKDNFAYFGKDFESYLRDEIQDYNLIEQRISEEYSISSKPGKAKAVAQHIENVPKFIHEISEKLEIIEMLGQS